MGYKAAIATCGGICPGLNDVIRSIVLDLHYNYNVTEVFGIRYGLQGFANNDAMMLTPDNVSGIHNVGGTILGSSRGKQPNSIVIDYLLKNKINVLFMIGGDGTLKAAHRIDKELGRRLIPIKVISIPKTIDNDIFKVKRSFGFDTAVEVAAGCIKAAHVEAKSYPNGIGMVKFFGRHSGFTAATAALAQQDCNFVLIPEVDFDLDTFIEALKRRLLDRGHAVIALSEGVGQHLFDGEATYDESGNLLNKDIGAYLRDAIEERLKTTVKYINSSYLLKSAPANSSDSVYCGFLARNAVKLAMEGKTGLLVTNETDHIPMEDSVGRQQRVDIDGPLWKAVLEITNR